MTKKKQNNKEYDYKKEYEEYERNKRLIEAGETYASHYSKPRKKQWKHE